MIYAPPGSGYQTPEDEELYLSDKYEPSMEYPGTMRPGRTPENVPLHDLPFGDDDPDPIPWPHFQEIDYYHVWDAPHPHPTPMDDFIEMEGRWATLEDEAEMRKDARRGVRERREAAEKEKTSHQVMDDTEDDDEDDDERDLDDVVSRMNLGDGVADVLNAGSESSDKKIKEKKPFLDMDVDDSDEDLMDDVTSSTEDDDNVDDDDDDDDDDDFLLELGLDLEGDDDEEDSGEEGDEIDDVDDEETTTDLLRAMQGLIDMDKMEDVDMEDDNDNDDFQLNTNDNDDDDNDDFQLNTNDDDDGDDDDNDDSLIEDDEGFDSMDAVVDDVDNDDEENDRKVVPIDSLNDDDELDDQDDITFSEDDNKYDDGGFDLDMDGYGGDDMSDTMYDPDNPF